MNPENLNRRQVGQILLSAAAVAYLSPGAIAQPFDKKKKEPAKPAGNQPTGPQIDFTRILRVGKTHDWTLRAEVNVSAYVQKPINIKQQMPEVKEFDFTSAAVIFPLMKTSSCSRSYDQELKSKVLWDERLLVDRPAEMLDTYPSGTRLGRWDLKAPEGMRLHGRRMQLEVEMSLTSWRTEFDERLAELVPWPSANWGPVAASTFTDLQRVGNLVLIDHNAEVAQDLVKRWCSNQDPKSIGPVVLAKWLAGNVLEYIQPSGSGLNFADNALLEGVDLQGSTKTLQDRRGTDQDITCALAAIYRAAGLPARVVIGFDVADDKGGRDSFLKRRRDVPAFRSWVEFCLYDEHTRREVWVPVDITRQRKKSSRILNNPTAWRYFGDNDEFDTVCPFAFQFHPPTTVLAHGSVSFWGWFTLPEAPKATQYLRFDAFTTPKTANTERDRRQYDAQTPDRR